MSWQRLRGRRIAKRHFHAQNLSRLAAQIEKSEAGHSGEVVVAIEAVSPVHETDSQLRAREVFGRLGVWDTPLNTGVLLYISLDRRHIELIADRGVTATQDQWQSICRQLQEAFSRQEYFSAVIEAVQAIEKVLLDHSPPAEAQPDANHLDNHPVILSS